MTTSDTLKRKVESILARPIDNTFWTQFMRVLTEVIDERIQGALNLAAPKAPDRPPQRGTLMTIEGYGVTGKTTKAVRTFLREIPINGCGAVVYSSRKRLDEQVLPYLKSANDNWHWTGSDRIYDPQGIDIVFVSLEEFLGLKETVPVPVVLVDDHGIDDQDIDKALFKTHLLIRVIRRTEERMDE